MRQVIRGLAVVVMGSVLAIPSIVQAEYASGFATNFNSSRVNDNGVFRSVLNQQGDRDIDSACGAMSFLILEDYFASQNRTWRTFYVPRNSRRKPSQRTVDYSKRTIKRSLDNIYSFNGLTLKSGVYIDTRKKHLREYALAKYSLDAKGWGATLMSTYASGTREDIYSKIRKNLNGGTPYIDTDDNPSIVIFKEGSALAPGSIAHFVVIFYANDSRVGYADPWTGKKKFVSKSAFMDSWVSTGITLIFDPES